MIAMLFTVICKSVFIVLLSKKREGNVKALSVMLVVLRINPRG